MLCCLLSTCCQTANAKTERPYLVIVGALSERSSRLLARRMTQCYSATFSPEIDDEFCISARLPR